MMATMIDVINELEAFATNHQMLNGYALMGKVIPQSGRSYPAMWVGVLPSTLQEGVDDFVFEIRILNQLESDSSNLGIVLSETNDIAKDVLAYFRNQYERFGFYIPNLPYTLVPITDDHKDVLAGHMFTVTFRTGFDAEEDNVPIIN